MPVTGLRLYGVALLPRVDGGALAREATVVRFRDLGALVQPAPYGRTECTAGELDAYRRVIDAAFTLSAVLPAPCGTTFRTADQVRHWLEQNYIALAEGIHFVNGRCELRLRIAEKPLAEAVSAPAAEAGAVAVAPVTPERRRAATAAANESFRALRRSAVAAVPVRHEDARELLGGAFLIAHDDWNEFTAQIDDEARRNEALTFEYTGPWPPYDFVRMEFGV